MLTAALLASLFLSQFAGRPATAYSARWQEAGLPLQLSDSVALLDSVDGFRLHPPLAFPARRIEERTGPAIPARAGEPGTLNLLYWGSSASMAFHFDPTTVRLDPATGALDFPRLFGFSPEQELSHLPRASSRPRRPVAARWKRGKWSTPPRLTLGAGTIPVPLRIGGSLALLRVEQASWQAGGWNLGTGPHLIEWLDKPSLGRIDTLKGALRLELTAGTAGQDADQDTLEAGADRIIGYGGASASGWAGGRYDPEENLRELKRLGALMTLEREAEELALRGVSRWSPQGSGWTGRLSDGHLRMDTAVLGTGERVGLAEVGPDGRPLGGTLLDTMNLPVPGGSLRFSPGTRLVQGLPALGGPGKRRLETDLSADLRTWIGLNAKGFLEGPLEPAAPSSRKAGTSQRLAYRDHGLIVSGRLAIERQESDDARGEERPDRFVTVLDSISIRLPGMTDTLGRPADTVIADAGSHELFNSGISSSSWHYRGPWRQWIDSLRPWIAWRFRPGLERYGDEYHMTSESLMVAWRGAPFQTVEAGRRSAPYIFLGGMFRCREAAPCPAIALPVPRLAVTGRPWPGLGEFTSGSELRLEDTTLSATMRLVPAPAWQPLLGSSAVRADLQGAPFPRPDGTWGLQLPDRPALVLRPGTGQLLAPERLHPLASGDTAALTSPQDSLRLRLTWSETFESPVFVGAGGKEGEAVRLLSLLWTGDAKGNLVSSRTSWEPLVRPLSCSLPDGSELRGIEPLRTILQQDGTVRSTEVRAKGLVLIRKGKTPPQPLDTMAHLDAKGRLLEKPGTQAAVLPVLQDRDGRVAVPLKDGSVLKVDRTEVSRKRWNECSRSGACPALPDDSCRLRSHSSRPGDSLRLLRMQSWRRLDPMPATCISHDEAEAFCRWSGGQLPTARQFQAVAEAALSMSETPLDRYWPTNRLNPSGAGDPWKPDGEDPFPDLAPSGSLRPLSPGLFDLSGNAEELCREGEKPRNGGPYGFRCIEPQAGQGRKTMRESTRGFRCVEK